MLKIDCCDLIKVLELTLPCVCCRECRDINWRVITDIQKFYSQYKEVKICTSKTINHKLKEVESYFVSMDWDK